jgi:hypothetical protein
MKKVMLWFAAFISLWIVAWYFGAVLGAAYDNVWNFNDFISIASGLGGMYCFHRSMTAAE